MLAFALCSTCLVFCAFGDFMHKKIYLQNIYLVSVGGISCTPALPSDIVAASGSVFI